MAEQIHFTAETLITVPEPVDSFVTSSTFTEVTGAFAVADITDTSFTKNADNQFGDL